MPANLDIVIVNWNAGAILRACLDSVFASDLGAGLKLGRVVVVDNASTDGSISGLKEVSNDARDASVQPERRLGERRSDAAASDLTPERRSGEPRRAYPPSFHLIALPENLGFARACNLGAAGSQADYLLFLNPDVVLDRDSLAGAVAFMEAPENRNVRVSGIRLRDEAGKTWRCSARLPTPGRMLALSLGLDRLLPHHFLPHFLVDWDHEDTRDVPQVIGAFLLIRRLTFETLGGFDERFFVYYEDVDLCLRVARSGGRVVHNANVSAVHLGGGTTHQIKARRQFLSAQSRIRYARKHFGFGQAVLQAANGVVLEPAVRMLAGLVRGSVTEMRDALKASVLLLGDLVHPSVPLAVPAPVKKRRRVLALTRYPRLGASSRTRFLAYLPALDAAGFDVTVAPFFDDEYLPALYAGCKLPFGKVIHYYLRRLRMMARARARAYDVVWVEKEALPWVPLVVERLFLQGVPMVVDFDDAWFHRYEAHRHFLVRSLLGTKFEGLVRLARVTVAGNDFLAAWARSAGARDIRQLATPVNLAHYQLVKTDPDLDPVGPLRIGWIGTPTSAFAYLRPLLPVLAEAIREGWATLCVVGANSADFAAIGAEIVPWAEDLEVAQLHRFDVGIMPLTDDLWSLGKCAYKLIQYMAVGLPVVASPVGMNRKVVHNGVNGFTAETPEEWRLALKSLAEDKALRQRMGSAGRRLVALNYSLSVIEPRLVEAFRRAID